MWWQSCGGVKDQIMQPRGMMGVNQRQSWLASQNITQAPKIAKWKMSISLAKEWLDALDDDRQTQEILNQ
jgi:hypothetical protein